MTIGRASRCPTGNPAIFRDGLSRPEALRPHLAAGLPLCGEVEGLRNKVATCRARPTCLFGDSLHRARMGGGVWIHVSGRVALGAGQRRDRALQYGAQIGVRESAVPELPGGFAAR